MNTPNKHHAIATVVVAVALISLSGCTAASDEPVSSSENESDPPSGALLFQWVAPTKDTIFVQETVAADPVALHPSTPAVNDVHPDWSPDGSQIAFVAEFYGYKEILACRRRWIEPATVVRGPG